MTPWLGQVMGLCWPQFGRIVALKAAYQCALTNKIPAGQRPYGLIGGVTVTLYGSERSAFGTKGPTPVERTWRAGV